MVSLPFIVDTLKAHMSLSPLFTEKIKTGRTGILLQNLI